MKHWLLTLSFIASFASYSVDQLTYGEAYTVYSKELNQQRTYYIKLPHNYHQSKNKYPVVYLLHGQWDLLPAVASIDMLSTEIPEVIVVGIQSKGPELQPQKTPSDFAKFLYNELIPLINHTYRAAPYKILSGHSNAGRFVINQWITNGLAFSSYYAFSPSLEDGKINERLLALSPQDIINKSPITLTLADEGDHMLKPFEEIDSYFSKIKSDKLTSAHFPEQTHSTSRHTSLSFALKNTFSGWQPSNKVMAGNFAALKEHYINFGKRFKFDAEIDIELLQKLSAYFVMSSKHEDKLNVKEVIKYGIALDNKNAAAFWEIVDYFITNGNELAATSIKEHICSILPQDERC